ncbi:MAG: PAS domain-containing sensor histidine kinase [Chitinophagaceae bacterium]|nr:MAG: PAS domain-containing sensor histidine kinase [Chitinophagaceae bacterium]
MKNRVPTPTPSLFVGPPASETAISRLETVQQITALDFLQHLPDIAWVVDEEGHLVNGNIAFFKTFRLDSRRSMHQPIASLIPPEIAARLSVQHRTVFNTGQAVKSDIRVTHGQDAAMTYHIHLFPLPPAAGRRILAGIACVNKQTSEQRFSTVHATMNDVPSFEIINKALQTERTRIGHELHDNVNQILSSAALYVDSLKPVNDRQTLIRTKGREYILLAIEEIRNLSRKLVAPYLDQKSLSEKIRALVQDIRITTSLQLAYSPGFPPDDLSAGKKLTLFRIIQEQVKNILSHSKATEAAITLDKVDDQILLMITDNGIGFDPKRMSKGVGLASILNRVSQYGGKLKIDADPGSGCRLTATIPMD